MVTVPKAFPLEFRRDVVAVARKGEATLSQIAVDFGGQLPRPNASGNPGAIRPHRDATGIRESGETTGA